MATTHISVAAEDAAVNAVTALLNGGTIEIRTGSMPATPATAASGTLLGTLTLSATAFSASSSGTATANAITGDASADATGTAGYFRAKSSGGTAVIDGDVGTSGAALNLNSVAIIAGGTINITAWTYTQPGA